ncbi:MAG: hypothetical protein WD576_04120 [Nitriliruptoraceae bacterium]
MQFDELRFVCQQAAINVVTSRGQPIPATVVLPGPERTRLVTLPQFPNDDEQRHLVIAQLAADHITADRVPCWGFIAEAQAADTDIAVVVYGARRHQPKLTAATFTSAGQLAEFLPEEDLDPTAMPFLHPLQHAVDALPAIIEGNDGDVFELLDPKRQPGHDH